QSSARFTLNRSRRCSAGRLIAAACSRRSQSGGALASLARVRQARCWMFISPLRRVLLVGFAVTCLAAAASHVAPAEHAASLVALVFAGSTYWLVLRKDAAAIEAAGLTLGGLFAPEPLNPRKIARDTALALIWTAATCAVIFPPFWLGSTLWLNVADPLVPQLRDGFWDEALGHLLVIARPEEMFYRGYLQSAIDDGSASRLKLRGARVGWGL